MLSVSSFGMEWDPLSNTGDAAAGLIVEITNEKLQDLAGPKFNNAREGVEVWSVAGISQALLIKHREKCYYFAHRRIDSGNRVSASVSENQMLVLVEDPEGENPLRVILDIKSQRVLYVSVYPLNDKKGYPWGHPPQSRSDK